MVKQPLWWHIATWFGISTRVTVARGTVGSLAALPFAYIIHVSLGSFGLLAASVVLFIIGAWAAEQFVRKAGKGEDPGEIVVDEVAGQWLLLSALFPTWQSYLVGFLLFRIFDVAKPWPVSLADRTIKGGIGVMFDDFLAAMYPVVVFLVIMLESHLFGGHNLLAPVVNFLSGASYVLP